MSIGDLDWVKIVMRPWDAGRREAASGLSWLSVALIAWVVVLQIILHTGGELLGWVWVAGSAVLLYVFLGLLARCLWEIIGS